MYFPRKAEQTLSSLGSTQGPSSTRPTAHIYKCKEEADPARGTRGRGGVRNGGRGRGRRDGDKGGRGKGEVDGRGAGDPGYGVGNRVDGRTGVGGRVGGLRNGRTGARGGPGGGAGWG